MSIGKPTLIVHTVYFPLADGESEVAGDPERVDAERLGLDLYQLLTRRREDRLSWGAGIPVRVATRYDRVSLSEASHVVIVPVLGRQAQGREDVRGRAIATMNEWARNLPAGHVLPVLASARWRAHEQELAVKPLLTELYATDDPRRATLDEIVLRLARVLSPDPFAARLFISHAKGDLASTENAAEEISKHVATATTGLRFFDRVSLIAGEDLTSQIDREAGRGVFVVVRGDSYSSRAWCLRELLQAKHKDLPTITVEVLANGEWRSFAYAGNGPTVTWERGKAHAAARVATLAMVECVRHQLFLAESKRVLDAADLHADAVICMGRAPELLDLAAWRDRPERALVILHPEPELSVHERGVLLAADKRLRPITPSMALLGAVGRSVHAPLDGWQVAMSLSDSPDVDGPDGYRKEHVDDATIFLARALIGVGAAIAYGGDFRTSGYTELLAQLIVAYNETASRPADLLHGYLAAHFEVPAAWKYPMTDHHLGPYGSSRGEVMLAPPTPGEAIPSHRAALYVSDMRRVMALHAKARVVLGGAARPANEKDRVDTAAARAAGKPVPSKGYGGRYPGVVEEAWRTLEAGAPLYVAGGFGGAAGLVAHALEHDEAPPRLQESTWAGDAVWTELVAGLADDPDVAKLGLPPTQDALAAAIRGYGRALLASDETSIAWNGLTVTDNRILFTTRDPLALAVLVLKGLTAVAVRKAKGKLTIELVEGDVTGATDLEVLVFPTFSDLDPGGAGAAIDRISGGMATQAHRAGIPIAPDARAIGADYLYAADLGPMNDVLADVAGRVRAAAVATATMARRHRFARIGLVTFLGNVASSVEQVVDAMVEGLRGYADGATVVWFERDLGRAALLARVLEGRRDVDLTRPVAVVAPAVEPPSVTGRTIVAIRARDQVLDIALLVPNANGLAPSRQADLDETSRSALAHSPDHATPTMAELTARGTRMAELLFGDSAAQVLAACGDTELVIVHDLATAGLPYEALGWGDGEGRVTPATRRGIVRHLLASVPADRGLLRPARVGKLGVLAVINPRDDLPEAAREGEAVLARLKAHANVVEVRELRGAQATVDAVRDGLADRSIDVIHYCGHAFYRGHGPHDSGLNCADGPLDLAALREVPRVPRVAFFNACQIGRMRDSDASAQPAQSFAELFLRAGVEAYVGTLWSVRDQDAETFAEEVYTLLGRGHELREAIVAGRKKLKDGGRRDWANYVLFGHAGFRLVGGTARGQPIAAAGVPRAWGRADASTLVACWSFAASEAPDALAVAVTERLAGAERPAATSGAIRLDRRNGSAGSTAIVHWVATVALKEPAAGRAFALRPTSGDPVTIGQPTATTAIASTRMASTPIDDLRALLDQQPDRGREILARLQPSADPDQLRAAIDEVPPGSAEVRAIWPFHVFSDPIVDAEALAAFIAVYPRATTDRANVASQQFQTREDWFRYAIADGAIQFVAGEDVRPPMWPQLRAADLTYDLRPDEHGEDLSVALFADFGNGLHAARAIGQQIVEAGLPYAFHLGDVYYGGNQREFREYFEAPLAPMFDETELFMISGNHEMFARGEWFQELLTRKAAEHPRQRQRGEMFRLRGEGFQIIGVDTMFVGWNAGKMRLHDTADRAVLDLLDRWLDERPGDLTVLLTTNEPWDLASTAMTPLYRSLQRTIAGRVDLWFWGNVHYAALYEPWRFEDAGSPGRHMIGSCIGHGGYPFYTQKRRGLPDKVDCRWLETRSRFWPEDRVRPDVGLNGWCQMRLARGQGGWDVKLTYLDWIGRERLRVQLTRPDGKSIGFVRVEESDIAVVGAEPTWSELAPARHR